MNTKDFNEEAFTDMEQKIELIEEQLSVSKKIESENKIFHKSFVSEEVELPIELLSEMISIERFPKNQEITELPQIRTEGNVTIVPVYEERAVVVKKIFLTEEIHIRKSEVSEQRIIKDTVRKEIFNEVK